MSNPGEHFFICELDIQMCSCEVFPTATNYCLLGYLSFYCLVSEADFISWLPDLLTDKGFTNIFSWDESCIFISKWCLFDGHIFLILMKSNLHLFPLWFLSFDSCFKSLTPSYNNILLCFFFSSCWGRGTKRERVRES